MTEPNWEDVDAVRSWLEACYPMSDSQTLSPFLQYLIDEQAKGKEIGGREKHLSKGLGGEFQKWVFFYSKIRKANYRGNYMRTTYYPEFVDPLELSPSPTPATDVETSPKSAQRELATAPFPGKQGAPKPKTEKFPRKGKTATNLKVSSEKSTTTKQFKSKESPRGKVAKQTDSKQGKLRTERLKSLRPRRTCKRRETGNIGCMSSISKYLTHDVEFFQLDYRGRAETVK